MEETETTSTEPASCCLPATEGSEKTTGCPMASMFEESVGSAKFGNLLLIPGTVLILVGALVLLRPEILVGLLAGTSILVGIAMVAMAFSLKRLAAGVRGQKIEADVEENP